MPRSLSDDLRQRVIETAIRWVSCWRRLGIWSADRMGPKLARNPLAACHEELIALVEQAVWADIEADRGVSGR